MKNPNISRNTSGTRRGSGKTLLPAVLLLAVAAVWLIWRLTAQSAGGIDGSTNARRIEFIESFGWSTSSVPDSVEEIRIPARFDEAYEQYNALQKEQGFDLRKYAAYPASLYTYRLTNYEGGDPVVPINANLIVVEGKIVGADISSAEAGGFVTVLAK